MNEINTVTNIYYVRCQTLDVFEFSGRDHTADQKKKK